jgi:hypothetical protein
MTYKPVASSSQMDAAGFVWSQILMSAPSNGISICASTWTGLASGTDCMRWLHTVIVLFFTHHSVAIASHATVI